MANALSNTQALFEGLPAPILSVATGVVQAVAPFFVDGRATVSLQVVYQGVVSNLVGLAVVAAEPGVYTVKGNDIGQAMALSADGLTNSAANPLRAAAS